jgi:hypothetical protein
MTLAGESYWESDHPSRHLGMSAFLAYMLAICIFTLGAGSSDLIAEYTFYSFNGIIYLGIPILGYLLLKNSGSPVFEKRRLFILVALGALSAVPPLAINPWGDGSLLLAPLLWLITLLFLGPKLARFESWKDALLAGSALAVGFVTFWMSPEVIPVPFLGFIHLTLDLNRPFLLIGQVWITLIALAVAAGISSLVYVILKFRVAHHQSA